MRPGAHYHMGGVDTDVWGRTELEGLYAAGEVACVSVHGANRLGGNALMETITFGKRAGRHAAEWALANTTVAVPPSQICRRRARAEDAARPHRRRAAVADPRRARARRCTRTSASSGARSRCCAQGEIVEGLRERYERVVVEDKGEVFNSDLTQALELGFLLELADCMVVAASPARRAAARTRGRTTIPDRDDENFLKHTLVRWTTTAPEPRLEAGDDDEVDAEGEDVLMAAVDETAFRPTATMDVALKIWRFASATGERELKQYEVEAPEWATLLDVLDIIKDRIDGTLAYRKSCRMMICGSCGMRMDGAAVLACKTRMYDIAQSGHVPVISAMGNLPIVKDLVVDMEPFWAKFRGDASRTSGPGTTSPRTARARRLAGADERDPQGVALHQLRLLRLRVQRDGVRARVSRPAGARQGHAVRRRPARRRRRSSGSTTTAASTGSGSARAATSATSAARRASTRATRSRSSAPRR